LPAVSPLRARLPLRAFARACLRTAFCLAPHLYHACCLFLAACCALVTLLRTCRRLDLRVLTRASRGFTTAAVTGSRIACSTACCRGTCGRGSWFASQVAPRRSLPASCCRACLVSPFPLTCWVLCAAVRYRYSAVYLPAYLPLHLCLSLSCLPPRMPALCRFLGAVAAAAPAVHLAAAVHCTASCPFCRSACRLRLPLHSALPLNSAAIVFQRFVWLFTTVLPLSLPAACPAPCRFARGWVPRLPPLRGSAAPSCLPLPDQILPLLPAVLRLVFRSGRFCRVAVVLPATACLPGVPPRNLPFLPLGAACLRCGLLLRTASALHRSASCCLCTCVSAWVPACCRADAVSYHLPQVCLCLRVLPRCRRAMPCLLPAASWVPLRWFRLPACVSSDYRFSAVTAPPACLPRFALLPFTAPACLHTALPVPACRFCRSAILCCAPLPGCCCTTHSAPAVSCRSCHQIAVSACCLDFLVSSACLLPLFCVLPHLPPLVSLTALFCRAPFRSACHLRVRLNTVCVLPFLRCSTCLGFLLLHRSFSACLRSAFGFLPLRFASFCLDYQIHLLGLLLPFCRSTACRFGVLRCCWAACACYRAFYSLPACGFLPFRALRTCRHLPPFTVLCYLPRSTGRSAVFCRSSAVPALPACLRMLPSAAVPPPAPPAACSTLSLGLNHAGAATACCVLRCLRSPHLRSGAR